MIITTFLRKAANIAVRMFSNERDKVVYAVPSEHNDKQRSLVVFRRTQGKGKTVNKSDVLRVRDVVCYAGTPNETIASANLTISCSLPKGMSDADMTAMIDDTVGILQNAETPALFKSGYLPN